ncbi:MAG: MoxR family ATPase [Deltaproteobacteria bacterium]|nr:MoxR family ATPase [Deltaproteobacteria bacterium]MBN2670835.1 MoxR family ATPase [Deltaproteobacteria bacterium]
MSVQQVTQKLIDSIQTRFWGNTHAVELAVCCFLSDGHLLIEDVPGVGKTTLAKAMAEAFRGVFNRIQFTSDLLPADIIGISIWNDLKKQFDFQKGPIFANIVLADEINRASPKTQSALLEAMSEKQISQEGVSHPLVSPFMVIATQNVEDSYGTYPLPESQLDRFTMRIGLGYTSAAVEKEIIRSSTPLADKANAESVHAMSLKDLEPAIESIQHTRVEDSVLNYIMEIVERTRQAPGVSIGVSPRGGIALFKCAKVYANLRGRDFVLPDDIQALAVPILAHRLVFHDETGLDITSAKQAETTIQKIIRTVEAPV